MIPVLKLPFERAGPNYFFEIENILAWINNTAVPVGQIALESPWIFSGCLKLSISIDSDRALPLNCCQPGKPEITP
jgi:hypothetical protein